MRLVTFLLLPLLVSACATSQPYQAMTQNYYHDAQTCRAQSPQNITVRVNRSGLTDQRLDSGFDANQYLQCMNRLGWRQERNTDPLLKAMETCQQQASHLPTATAEGRGVKLGASLDQAAFRECLKQRGFEGEVLVQPLEPAR